MAKDNNMGTFTLTTSGGPNSDGIYTINREAGIYNAALYLSSGGSATVKGAAVIDGFGPSVAVPLIAEIGTTLANQDPIDNVIITVTVGSVKMFCNQ